MNDETSVLVSVPEVQILPLSIVGSYGMPTHPTEFPWGNCCRAEWLWVDEEAEDPHEWDQDQTVLPCDGSCNGGAE